MIASKEDISRQFREGQTTNALPPSSKIKIPYFLIPGEIRLMLAKIVFAGNAKSFHNDLDLFPAPYQDCSIDTWIRQNTTTADDKKWHWPENKKCALILSHDTDTAKQEKGINMLIDTADERGIKNTFSFVGKDIAYYDSFLMELKSRGIEIALHDVVHDNMIAFGDKAAIKNRLTLFTPDKLTKYDVKGFRSPSWYVSPNLWNALGELDFLYDMSALDTYPFFEKGVNHGMCTFHPFVLNKLVILPNTIPFELPWLLGYKVNETFEFWKKKFDTIGENGGLFMFNAHPDRWYSGNKKANYQLQKCLDYIIEKFDPAKLISKEAAQHAIIMKNSDKMSEIDKGQKIYVPNL